MKKSTTLIAAYCCMVTLTLFSCNTSKNSIANDKQESEIMVEHTSASFVQYLDGSIQNFQSLKLITGILVTPHLLGDGNKVIYAKDILAYQDNKQYAVSQKLFKSKRKSFVAKETLPGFAIKVISGKINVYKRTIFNGERATEQFFLQNGTGGEICAYSPELMNELLKSNPEVLNYFKSKTLKENLFEKLQTTVCLFNNDMAVTKN